MTIPTNITTLYFSDSTNSIVGISGETLTQTDISNNTYPLHVYSDISAITIGTDVTKLGSFLFTDCINLSNITIYNTDILTDIGLDVFNDISSNGIYSFYSANNYLTINVKELISLLPRAWTSTITYTYYTEFAVLCNEMTRINKNTAEYYNFTPIDISYADFHSLFFPNNSYFTLNTTNYGKNKISPSNLKTYITINTQTERIYFNEDLTVPPQDISFNLLSKVLSHYQYNMSSQYWSIESTIQINRQLSSLKTIFNFQEKCCNNTIHKYPEEDKCKCKSKCINSSSCAEKNSTKITIDDFFNMFEAQGIEMATTNSFTPAPIAAAGLPIDAKTSTMKYTAILTLYLRSNNSNVHDIGFKMPFLINFSGSMPKSLTDMNNYRYNP